MAEKVRISKEVRRTIRLKFLTDTGKNYTISLNCASAKLAGAEGAALVKSVMEKILEYDVFTVKLVGVVSAELVERRVILTADDFNNEKEHAKTESVREVYDGERAGETKHFTAPAISRQTQRAAVKHRHRHSQSCLPSLSLGTMTKAGLCSHFT